MLMAKLGTRGYTFIEMLFVLTIISLFLLLAVPVHQKTELAVCTNSVIEELTYSQLTAIKENSYFNHDNQTFGFSVTFTRTGNVTQAQTIRLPSADIVVSLGTGRIYEKP